MFDQKYLEQIQATRSLSDFVHEAIHEAIISGRIPPGTKLKQLVLAGQLDVSQQTVREALKRLVASGLVLQKPNKGFQVTSTPLEEQEDIYKLRAVLEAFAVEEAAAKISDYDLHRMRELLPFTAYQSDDIPLLIVRQSNREFHMIPAWATGNRHLARILEQIWDLTWTYFLRNNEEKRRASARDDLEEHAEILKALEQRDGSAARQAMLNHIQHTIDTFFEYKDSVLKQAKTHEY